MSRRETSAEAVLLPHLRPGERLLWAGRPKQHPMQAIMTAFIVPMDPGLGHLPDFLDVPRLVH